MFTLPLLRLTVISTLFTCLFLSHSSIKAGAAEEKFFFLPYIGAIMGNGAPFPPPPPAGPSTANNYVPPYVNLFQSGLNPGYYGNGWSDTDIYQLCYDAGCRSARNTLPDSFLAQWGTTIRVNSFRHIVNNLGFKGITTFLQTPRDEWRATEFFGGSRSKLWQGLYEPIWDNGQNGTPVNDSNRFALYVWHVVKNYGQFIDFYEIINEPDYTYSNHGWEAAGQPGSWWNNVPKPEDLPNLSAPVYHYIRLLRIAYTVIKRYDPKGYITPGGLGYQSFLDVILRSTDNPDGGKVNSAYPLKGGAYFDTLSMHNYPQYGTRYYENGQWIPDRHSDKAVSVFLGSHQEFAAVLAKHGYNGIKYPQKPYIITEMNVARKQIGETLGGKTLQRNFTIKAIVKAQQADIKLIQWFLTGEGKSYNDPTAGPYDLMGFYENLKITTPGNEQITDQGVANRTTYEQLYGWHYDANATATLNLPATVDGAAFVKNSQIRYALWAKTTADRSENASASINMPESSYTMVHWDGSSETAAGNNLQLTGAPVFLTP